MFHLIGDSMYFQKAKDLGGRLFASFATTRPSMVNMLPERDRYLLWPSLFGRKSLSRYLRNRTGASIFAGEWEWRKDCARERWVMRAMKNRQKSPRASGTAGKHLSPIFTQAVRCDATEKGLCERCMFIQKSFFGIVLNVYSGLVSAAERDLGGLWTFFSSYKDQTNHTGDRHLFHDRKKRKLSDERDDRSKKEVANNIPQSTCLIINGLADSSLTKHRSGLKPGIVRQIESLVAQGTLSGIVARKTEQHKDSVQKVTASVAAKDDDEDYHMLKESKASAISLAQDEEKSFART